MSTLALLFLNSLLLGFFISIAFGEKSQREAMAVLLLNWAIQYTAFALSYRHGIGVPVLPYLMVDIAATAFLISRLRENWQVVVIYLYLLHIVVHLSFFIGVAFTAVPPTNRPYADIQTCLGYLQIFVISSASIAHERSRRNNAKVAGDDRYNRWVRWALGARESFRKSAR